MTARKCVLVTGATGFIGRHVIPELQSRGYEIHTITRHGASPPPAGAVQHIADLADEGRVDQILGGIKPSHLLHLAWDVTPGKFWSDQANLEWVAAGLLLYRGFAEHGGTRAVFAGSFAEYDWDFECLGERTTPLRPRTLYGAAKCALHDLIRRAAAQDGVSLAWARLFMLYGPHERRERLVPYITTSLLRGETALCGDGAAIRDFLHVTDAARMMASVLDSEYEGPINIAAGQAVALSEVMTEIARLTGRPELLQRGARPAPADEPRLLAASVSALASLGLAPQFTLAGGLADTVNWWRAELQRHT
jgi:nucleoside-diphosphate-sugar epimerase